MDRLINIISKRSAVLRALLDSKINNTIIGIHATSLGAATYLTAVREILVFENDEPLIVLAECDITGSFLSKNALRISDIISVIPFISPFENPLLKQFNDTESLNKN